MASTILTQIPKDEDWIERTYKPPNSDYFIYSVAHYTFDSALSTGSVGCLYNAKRQNVKDLITR